MQHAGGMLLPPVQKLVATIIFAIGKNATKSGRYLPRFFEEKATKSGRYLPHFFEEKANKSGQYL